MKKKVLAIIILSIVNTIAAPDYFPVRPGNTWEFTYHSNRSLVLANPYSVYDSGIVRWEVMETSLTGGKQVFPVKQTRSLLRQIMTGGLEPGYDSVFSSPRISIDTLFFQQAVITVDTLVHRADSLMNAVSFNGASCPVVVHNPMGFLPDEVVTKDTVVILPGTGSTINTVRIGSKACGCMGIHQWSFILAPDIGPVGCTIGHCTSPDRIIVGATFSETRRLISWSFPTSVRKENLRETRLPGITIRRNAKTIECSFANAARPVSVELYTVTGKSIMRFASGESGKAIGNVGFVPAGFYILKVGTSGGIVTKGIWLGR